MPEKKDRELPPELQRFAAQVSPLISTFLEASRLQEATLWLETTDAEHLRAVCSPCNPDLVGVRQPLGRGLISQVHLSGLPLLEPDVSQRHDHDPTVDSLTGTPTRSLLAVPISSDADVIGVLSGVILESAPPSSHARPEDLDDLATLAEAIGNYSSNLPTPS